MDYYGLWIIVHYGLLQNNVVQMSIVHSYF